MPITIKSGVVGPLFMGAYASGASQAQAKRMAQQMELASRERTAMAGIKYRQQEDQAQRDFIEEQNNLKTWRNDIARPTPEGIQFADPDIRNEYNDIVRAQRELLNGGMFDPSAPQTRSKIAELDQRRRALEDANPVPDIGSKFDRNRVFTDSTGSRVDAAGNPYTTLPEGGTEYHVDPRTGAGTPVRNPAQEQALKDQQKLAEEQKKAQQEAEAIARKDWEFERSQAADDLKEKKKAIRNNAEITNPNEQIKQLEDDFKSKWGTRPAPQSIATPPAPQASPVGAAPNQGQTWTWDQLYPSQSVPAPAPVIPTGSFPANTNASAAAAQVLPDLTPQQLQQGMSSETIYARDAQGNLVPQTRTWNGPARPAPTGSSPSSAVVVTSPNSSTTNASLDMRAAVQKYAALYPQDKETYNKALEILKKPGREWEDDDWILMHKIFNDGSAAGAR